MKLQGRAAIVTGGAGGLGSATVRWLTETGMGVVIFDRDGERASQMHKEMRAFTLAVGGDTTEDKDVAAAIKGRSRSVRCPCS